MSTTESAETGNRFTEWLADHPRLMGALFLVLLAVTQSGAVAANATGSATAGP